MKAIKLLKEKLSSLKRVSFDLLILFFIGIFLFKFRFSFTDDTSGLSLFLYKGLLISAGIVHAHISRKLMFPLLHSEEAFKDKSYGVFIFMAVWYGIIIFGWSRGG